MNCSHMNTHQLISLHFLGCYENVPCTCLCFCCRLLFLEFTLPLMKKLMENIWFCANRRAGTRQSVHHWRPFSYMKYFHRIHGQIFDICQMNVWIKRGDCWVFVGKYINSPYNKCVLNPPWIYRCVLILWLQHSMCEWIISAITCHTELP